MKHLSVMIKPASSLCNLRCRYCFYADLAAMREVPSFGIMSRKTLEGILSNIRQELNPGDHITFAFQGGEPTLAGLEYFRDFTRITDEWKDVTVNLALQTNGILLDDRWAEYLRAHRYLVGISYDILPKDHDACRVDSGGEGTGNRVLQAIRLLERHRVDYNVLCTLTSQIARHPALVWKQILSLDLKYVQFTPCLDELDSPGTSVYALTPQRFARFYNQLFPMWLEAYRRGEYRSIKFFDDVVNLIHYGVPTACGMNGTCQPQIVVEADGSTYPCDFYCLDQWRLGNLGEEPLRKILASPQYVAFREREHIRPRLCGTCPYLRFCGGNCKRMQAQICCSGEDTFCGYRAFLDENRNALTQIAMEQRAYAEQVGR